MERLILDTNIVVRLLVGYPEDQAARCRALLAAATDPLGVPDCVVCEAAWVLEKMYGRSRADVATALGLLLGDERIRCDKRLFGVALGLYAQGPLSIVDSYVAARTMQGGERLATFDERLRKTPGIQLANI